MDYIKINSIPQVVFAHHFSSETYNTYIMPRKNVIEVTYLNAGETSFTQNDESFHAHPGDIFCNFHQGTLYVKTDQYHSHSTVGFYVDFDISDHYSENYIPLNKLTSVKDSAKYKAMIDKIIGFVAITNNGSLRTAGLFLQLIDALSVETIKTMENSVDYYNPYVKSAKLFINENLSTMLKQKEIAKYLKITPEYLCSVFKKATGESIIHYINRIKLEKIYSIMKRERITLCEASELFGYSDPSYVSRLYKKYFGVKLSDSLKSNEIS